MKEKFVQKEATLEDAISEAYSEMSSLAEEMREAFDNTPESLQSSSVGQARSDAADSLEEIEEPSVPDELKAVKLVYHIPNRTPRQFSRRSRPARRDDATMILDAVLSSLQEIVDDGKEELSDIAQSLFEDVERMKDTAEAVEFPGMYG